MTDKELLQEYKNQDDRLFVAKVLDKINFTKTKNKIQYTDFLNLYEQEMCLNIVKKLSLNRFYFFGGEENTERKILVIYPEKLTEEMSRKNDSSIISIIRIELPKELKGEYSHRDYLGAIMKLGVEREKIGDIITNELGADIVVKNEITNFLVQNISSLTRFQSANISIVNLSEIKDIQISKLELSAVVISLRLDNIVAVLAKTSRNKAIDIIMQERVFLNFKLETKSSKQVKVGDCITIRGKGRFEFKEISGNTRKGRYVVKFDKFV